MKKTTGTWLRTATLGIVLAAPACNMLLPAMFVGEHKKKITAEFDKLEGTRTLVLAWAPPATLFDYPYIRFEVASRVTGQLASRLRGTDRGTDLVDPRDVADYLQKEPDAAADPMKVGRQFDADYVVFVEISRFQIRDPHSPELLQGTIEAGVSVFDMHVDPDLDPRHELTPVEAVYPPNGPKLMTATNAQFIREATYDIFSEQVARKFYDYTVDL